MFVILNPTDLERMYMQITSLGQAGFLIDFDQTRFLIDPYLSNYVVTSGAGSASLFSREFVPPFQPNELHQVFAIFITHDHADHCDPETIIPILKNNPDCMVFGPRTVVDLLISMGVDRNRCQLAKAYIPFTHGEISFTAVPSAHYELQQDPITGENPYLGYVFKVNGFVFYHSGDTILYQGMEEGLLSVADRYDVCMLPVNGRDEKREGMGITGNLEPAEAVKLAGSLGAKILIPMHNDLFKINQREPRLVDEFAKENHQSLQVQWLTAGDVLKK